MKTLRFTGCSFVVLAGLLMGCVNVDVTKTGKGSFAPTRPDDIQVLMTVPPKADYTELATISTAGWSTSETAKMHNALRTKSAPMGAHAVILTSTGIHPATGLFSSPTMWANGVAIRFNNPPAPGAN
ncbi:MAG: hypothetical protein WD768_06245 [Phycisphaeraceae bacterium]